MTEMTIQQAFEYCPRCASKNPHPGAVPFHCPQCDLTRYFGPVAAVGGLIINDRDELLMVRRAKAPGKGMLGLPGGFVDGGESVEEALAREILEETSLVVSSFDYLMSGPNRYVHEGIAIPVVDLFFLAQAPQDATVLLDQSELSEFLWVVPTDQHLESMAFDSNRRAVECWINLSAGSTVAPARSKRLK